MRKSMRLAPTGGQQGKTRERDLRQNTGEVGAFFSRLWPWLTTAVAGWVAYRWILWSRRGFDFQDEGAYLLISQDPWKNASPSFYGFVLHPLYLLGFQDPGWFRLLSVLLLAGAGGACAYVWCRRQGMCPGVLGWKTGVMALLATGALLVYSDGQRTPNYNTLVFFGALVAWTGYFGLGLEAGFRRASLWALVIGIGLAFLAKWPAGFLLVILFVSLLWKNRLVRTGDAGVVWQALLLTGIVSLGWIGKQGIQDTVDYNRLVVENSPSYGLQLLPFYGVTLVNFLYRCLRAFAYGAPLLVLVWLSLRQKPAWCHWLAKSAWLIPWLILGGGLLFGLTRAGASSFSRVGSNVAAEILWLAAIAWLLVPWRRWGQSGFRMDEAVGLILTPFLLGVGTNTALGDYAGHGALFFQLAGLGIWQVLQRRGLSRGLLASLLFLGSILNLLRAEASLRDQFRTAPMEKCTIPWTRPSGGTVYLDAQQAKLLQGIRARVEAWGFRRGDPIIAIGDMPGVVYFLGGYSPGMAWYPATHQDQIHLVTAFLRNLEPEIKARSFLIMNEASPLFADRRDVQSTLGLGTPVFLGPYFLNGTSQRLGVWGAPLAHKDLNRL